MQMQLICYANMQNYPSHTLKVYIVLNVKDKVKTEGKESNLQKLQVSRAKRAERGRVLHCATACHNARSRLALFARVLSLFSPLFPAVWY